MNYSDPERFDQQKVLLKVLALFYVVYIISTILLQIRSELPPYKGGGPTDQMNGALIWMSSITALLIATVRAQSWPKFLLWLGVAAAGGAVAIDEVFEFHERTRHTLGDDDYLKIGMLVAAFVGAFILYRVEQPSKIVVRAFVAGLVAHTLYILTDMGDGDYFMLPGTKV